MKIEIDTKTLKYKDLKPLTLFRFKSKDVLGVSGVTGLNLLFIRTLKVISIDENGSVSNATINFPEGRKWLLEQEVVLIDHEYNIDEPQQVEIGSLKVGDTIEMSEKRVGLITSINHEENEAIITDIKTNNFKVCELQSLFYKLKTTIKSERV